MPHSARAADLALGFASVLGLGSLSISAQEPAKADVPKSARRVPPGFSKVGISDEQREKIYAIRASYVTKVADLKKQLEVLQAKELADCEAVLTDAQRKLLAAQREATKSKGSAKKAEPAKPAEEKKGN